MTIQTQPEPACATTAEVRDFYELYPYPSSSVPTLRNGFGARLVLSRVHTPRAAGKRIEVLDAGCGRGIGLIANAALNPDVHYVGIDLCNASLADAQVAVAHRRLTNVDVQEIDLMTLEGLSVPAGGFDLIYSSGVVHHLADPEGGLRKLGDVLSSSGVIVLMVYGTIGRRHIRRVQTALESWLDRGLPLAQQLATARTFVQALAKSDDPECAFQAAAICPDAEFVDRYMHPNETDYDVPGLFDLIERAGLRFLGWQGSQAYSLDGVLEPGPVRDSIEALPERERFTVIEQIHQPKNHQLFLCKPENGPRRLPPQDQWGELLLAPNPEASFQVAQRNLWGQSRTESISYAVYDGEATLVEDPALQKAALLVASQNEPFRGGSLVQALVEDGLEPLRALAALKDLIELELVYAPHEIELA